MNLQRTVAVVTGGGTGIGRAIALALARAGADAVVVNFQRSIAEAEATAAEPRRWAHRSRTIAADVADDIAVRSMAARVLAELGRVDVLVNNAGDTRAVPHADLDELTDEVWHDIIDVNLLGAFHCTRAFAPALRQSSGAVVNISSISGYRAGGASIAYGVSKAALLQLTRNLAVALGPEVRVNAVAPGSVATPRRMGPHGEEGLDRSAWEREDRPLPQTAEPEHIAQAVLGLLGMDLVTGEAVIVDGGRHVHY